MDLSEKVLESQKITKGNEKYSDFLTTLKEIENDLVAQQVSEKEHEKILLECLKYLQEGKELDVIRAKAQELIAFHTQLNIQNDQKEILKETHYNYYGLIKDNTGLVTKIETELSKTPENPETVETRCKKIESIWISYMSSSLDIKEIPSDTIQSMSTGFSLYLTDRLNKSGTNIASLVGSTKSIENGGSMGDLTKNLMSVFSNIKGFGEVMTTINAASKAINNNASSIMIEDKNGQKTINPSCSHVFNTPHGFYDRLQGSQIIKQPNNPNISFGQAFVDSKGTSNKKTIQDTVIAKLQYTPEVHKLLTEVVDKGKSVLDMRVEAKTQIDSIYEQVQGLISSTGGILGESVTEIVDSMGLRGIADFVCLLLGYGTVEGMEKKYREKQLNKDLTSEERASLDRVAGYARKRSKEYSTYEPSKHDDPKSLLSISGLGSVIKKHNETKDAKQIDLTAFPTSPDIITDSFVAGFEEGKSFPDPSILLAITETAPYLESSFDKDGNQIYIISKSKKAELSAKLQEPAIVDKIVAEVLGRCSDPSLLAKFTEIANGESSKTPADFVAFLFSICLAPVNASDARKHKALNSANLGKGVVIQEMVGRGIQKEEEVKKNVADTSQKELKTLEEEKKTHEETAKKEAGELDAKEKKLKEDLTKETDPTKKKAIEDQITAVKKEKDDALAKYTKISNDINEKINQITKNNPPLSATPEENTPASPNPAPSPIATLTPTPSGLAGNIDYNNDVKAYVKIDNIDKKDETTKAIEATKYLISKHNFTIQGAIGIVANIIQESHFNVTVSGDNGTSYGICQRHKERKVSLLKYLGNHSESGKVLYNQLDFLVSEKGFENTFAKIKKSTDIVDSTNTFCKEYEIPADKEKKSKERVILAKEFYKKNKKEFGIIDV